MIVNADKFSAIGRAHKECQDYVSTRILGESAAMGFLSDGCSSSPNTDIGARILVKTAERLFGAGIRPPWDHAAVTQIIQESAKIAGELGIDLGCLDATLWGAWFDGVDFHVHGIGDGVVVARRREDGVFEAYCVSYDSGAPAYLSYHLNPERFAQYLAEFGDIHQRITFFRKEEDPMESQATYREIPTLELKFGADKFDLVAVISDGACSFSEKDQEKGALEPVDVHDVIVELFDIKSFAGDFVHRRGKAFLQRTCPNWFWTHSDDLSMFAIYAALPATTPMETEG